MFKITEYPGVVRNHLDFFCDIFSKPQQKHFSEYLTGLIVCEKINIKQINNKFIGHSDYSNKDRFMTTSDWPIEQVDERRKELINDKVNPLNPSNGYLVIDDTLIEKTGKQIPEVGRFYDHGNGRYVLAHNIVTSHYVTPRGCFPIGYKLYLKRAKTDKTYTSKIEHAKELVSEAINAGFSFKTVVYDAWYFSKELCDHIEQLGLNWLGVAKSNRIIFNHGNRLNLQQFRAMLSPSDFKKIELNGKVCYGFTKTVKMSKLGNIRLLIVHENKDLSDDALFLVTNALRWDARRILKIYLFRWSIETFYRDSKQNLGLGAYAMRELNSIKRHWYLVFLSYSLLVLSSMDGMLRNWFNTNVRTIGEKCRSVANEILYDFTFWIVNKVKEQKNMDEIMTIIFKPKAKIGSRFNFA